MNVILKILLVTICCLLMCHSVQAEKIGIDFEKQIAPIFVKHCVRCHSSAIKKGDISLNTIDDLTASGNVIAGDPANSYLIDLVTSQDGETPAMPKEAEPLSNNEVDLLREWIQQGAVWPVDVLVKEQSKANGSWWSLQPLHIIDDSSQLGIDDFIEEKLIENGLTFSPEADRRTLIRRLSFDLHGLPPTPEEVLEFVENPDPEAYAKLVDQLLESPRYGERFARHWLDLAHYADTHGFERDQRRDYAWRYRDYVINSFNEDKSYTRFLQEQIAGDVLWPDDNKAVIATGFLAAGPWDYVGQVETKSQELRRSARSLDLDDMATQVMATTMATTINCCRCHDHKLDPISQREYYQMRAVFAGITRRDRVVSDTALKQYEATKTELTERIRKISSEIDHLEGAGIDLADIVGGGTGLSDGTSRQGIDPRTGEFETRDFRGLGNVVVNQFVKSNSKFIDGVFIPDGENGKAEITVSTTGLKIAGLPKTSGAAWDIIRNGPVTSQHSTKLGGIDFAKEGHRLLGLHANGGVTFDLDAIRSEHEFSEMRFTTKLGYFGASGDYRADARIYLDGELIAEFLQLKRDQGLQDIDIKLPNNKRFLTFVVTDGGNSYSHDQIGFGDPMLKSVTANVLTEKEIQRLASLRQDRIATSEQLSSLQAPPRFYGVVGSKKSPPVHLLVRGDSESPEGEPLAPAALQSLTMLDPDLGKLDSAEGERRAALAKWITHPDNPLTPRVIVNRLWHWHFGQGIVDSPSDFGFGGGQPSHPELLDWLALQLQERDWSLKAMHRLILNSQTYQQQSRHSEDAAGVRVDAENRLLWRQNSSRLEAEAIRDSVLLVSGKLNNEKGGPGFEDFTYQEAYAPIYRYITADKPAQWRRSIYRYVVRTTPNRFLTSFDCPDPANLTAKRITTTTPLQSLVLYNNDFMLQQSRYFAQRVQTETNGNAAAEVDRVYELSLSRLPTQYEQRLAITFVEQHGLFALCRILFNANEFLYVD